MATPATALRPLPPGWLGWLGGLRRAGWAVLLAPLLVLLLCFCPAVALAVGPAVGSSVAPAPALALQPPGPPDPLPGVRRSLYRCDGDPLAADLVRGAVDDPAIPDPSSGTVPVGGVVVLHWRDRNLQLPRTNNAGATSFTDGRWWWSLEVPDQPRFRLRRSRGDVQEFSCEPA
jgi:hypothetical protein